MELSFSSFALASFAVVLVGISKAGFGGGTGILATPLMALALPAKEALGTLLPLLILCDWISCYFYRRHWELKPLLYFLPACGLGVFIASFFLQHLANEWLEPLLGAICIWFCFHQWRKTSSEKTTPLAPNWKRGNITGFFAGIFSTLAHAAGPIFAMYLLPSKYKPTQFVGTAVLAFTIINLIKLPSFFGLDIITTQTLYYSLILSPFVAIGTFIGVWCNQKFEANLFTKIIYLILFLTGVKLIFSKSLLHVIGSFAT